MFYSGIPRHLNVALLAFLFAVLTCFPCLAYADDDMGNPDETLEEESQEVLSEHDLDNNLSNPSGYGTEESKLELADDSIGGDGFEEVLEDEDRLGTDDDNERDGAQLIDELTTEGDEETTSVDSIERDTETDEPLLSSGLETRAFQSSEKKTSKETPVLAKADASSCPTASLSYMVHVQNKGNQAWKASPQTAGTTGHSLRLEALRVKLIGEAKGSVQYVVHVQNIGWQSVCADGAEAGTHGQSLRLEAARLALTGEVSEWYDILYRVHVQNVGWQGWVKNGDLAGTVSKGLRLEARFGGG